MRTRVSAPAFVHHQCVRARGWASTNAAGKTHLAIFNASQYSGLQRVEGFRGAFNNIV